MLNGKANENRTSTSTLKAVGQFIADMKDELGKVTWTSPDEMQLYIKVVVLSTLTFGFGVYAVDLVIQATLHGLSAVVQWIGG